MASSRNNLDESAPESMYQYVSLDDNYEHENSSILKCHFCHFSKTKFYCVECVQNGNFTHSTPKKGLERFADKKLTKYQIEERKIEILKKYDKRLSRRKQAEDLRLNVLRCKEKIRLLRENIADCKKTIKNDSHRIEELKVKQSQIAQKLNYFPEKLPAFHEYREGLSTAVEHKKTKLFSEQSALETITRKRLKELVTFIFPITKVPSATSRSSDGQRKAELQEASAFTYIRGIWTYGVPTDDSYSIVEPNLVVSGDFSAYTSWCEKDELSACRDTADEKERFEAAFGCSAALQYTAQLVNNITTLFDFHVPKRTSFNDFCNYESHEQFCHHVAKLNANILDLCLVRKVDYSKLRPEGPISNLLLIIDPESNERMINTVEEREKYVQPVEDAIEKDMLSEAGSDDSLGDIESEYVHVSEEEGELPESVSMQASFIATSLHSVSTFWKTATGQK